MKFTKLTIHKPCISFINGKIYLRVYDEDKQEMVTIKEIENEHTNSKDIGHKTKPEQSESN
jgi:hypothetical protein